MRFWLPRLIGRIGRWVEAPASDLKGVSRVAALSLLFGAVVAVIYVAAPILFAFAGLIWLLWTLWPERKTR